jgi:hypothetical protein
MNKRSSSSSSATAIVGAISPGAANYRDGSMKQKAKLYERRGKLFVRTSSMTTTGIWLEVGDCTSLEGSASTEEIADAVRLRLAASGGRVRHPRSFGGDDPAGPLLRAAAVGSWSTFGKLAKCVKIEEEEGRLRISPTINNRPGFTVIEDGVIQVPVDTDSRVLGEHLRQALAASK